MSNDEEYKPNAGRTIRESVHELFNPDKSYCPICDEELQQYERYCAKCWTKPGKREAVKK